jgi:hypothetical protein
MVIGLVASSAGQVTSITQTGVTWTKDGNKIASFGSYFDAEVWTGVVGSGASANISIAYSITGTIDAVICEYWGGASSVAVDKVSSGNSGVSTTVDSGTTGTTSTANEVWVGSLFSVGGTVGWSSITNGFSLVNSVGYLGYFENIVSSTGTADVSATVSISNPYAGIISTTTIAAGTNPSSGHLFSLLGVGT